MTQLLCLLKIQHVFVPITTVFFFFLQKQTIYAPNTTMFAQNITIFATNTMVYYKYNWTTNQPFFFWKIRLFLLSIFVNIFLEGEGGISKISVVVIQYYPHTLRDSLSHVCLIFFTLGPIENPLFKWKKITFLRQILGQRTRTLLTKLGLALRKQSLHIFFTLFYLKYLEFFSRWTATQVAQYTAL